MFQITVKSCPLIHCALSFFSTAMDKHRCTGNSACGSDMSHDNDNETYTIKRDAFHVDTGMIPQAALEDQGSLELEQLGLSVFNQDVFEEGPFLLNLY